MTRGGALDGTGEGVMRARRFAVLAALGGTAVLAGGLAIGVAGFGSRGIENTDAGPIDGVPATATASVAAVATSHAERPEHAVVTAPVSIADAATADADSTGAPAAMSVGEALTADPDPPEPAFVLAGVSAAAAPVAEAALPEARPPPPPEKRVQLASLFTSDPEKEYPKPAVRLVETPNECLVAEICIDEYLWSLYERTPKVDTNKVLERVKVKVKTKKGKTRTVTKTK